MKRTTIEKRNASRERRRTRDTIPGGVLDIKTNFVLLTYLEIALPPSNRIGSYLSWIISANTIQINYTIRIASAGVPKWYDKNTTHNASCFVTSERYGSDPSGDSRRCTSRNALNTANRIKNSSWVRDPSGDSRQCNSSNAVYAANRIKSSNYVADPSGESRRYDSSNSINTANRIKISSYVKDPSGESRRYNSSNAVKKKYHRNSRNNGQDPTCDFSCIVGVYKPTCY